MYWWEKSWAPREGRHWPKGDHLDIPWALVVGRVSGGWYGDFEDGLCIEWPALGSHHHTPQWGDGRGSHPASACGAVMVQ